MSAADGDDKVGEDVGTETEEPTTTTSPEPDVSKEDTGDDVDDTSPTSGSTEEEKGDGVDEAATISAEERTTTNPSNDAAAVETNEDTDAILTEGKTEEEKEVSVAENSKNDDNDGQQEDLNKLPQNANPTSTDEAQPTGEAVVAEEETQEVDEGKMEEEEVKTDEASVQDDDEKPMKDDEELQQPKEDAVVDGETVETDVDVETAKEEVEQQQEATPNYEVEKEENEEAVEIDADAASEGKPTTETAEVTDGTTPTASEEPNETAAPNDGVEEQEEKLDATTTAAKAEDKGTDAAEVVEDSVVGSEATAPSNDDRDKEEVDIPREAVEVGQTNPDTEEEDRKQRQEAIEDKPVVTDDANDKADDDKPDPEEPGEDEGENSLGKEAITKTTKETTDVATSTDLADSPPLESLLQKVRTLAEGIDDTRDASIETMQTLKRSLLDLTTMAPTGGKHQSAILTSAEVARAKEICDFMILDDLEEMLTYWLSKRPTTDDRIWKDFADDVSTASAGKYEHWSHVTPENPRMVLALVLLLDHFRRNMYRGTRAMCSCDAMCIQYAKRAIKAFEQLEDDTIPTSDTTTTNDSQSARTVLKPQEWLLLLWPLTHSEDLEDQHLCLYEYSKLEKRFQTGRDEPLRVLKNIFLAHFSIIQEFGRFPHRNAILGRNNTPEEDTFLLQENAKDRETYSLRIPVRASNSVDGSWTFSLVSSKSGGKAKGASTPPPPPADDSMPVTPVASNVSMSDLMIDQKDTAIIEATTLNVEDDIAKKEEGDGDAANNSMENQGSEHGKKRQKRKYVNLFDYIGDGWGVLMSHPIGHMHVVHNLEELRSSSHHPRESLALSEKKAQVRWWLNEVSSSNIVDSMTKDDAVAEDDGLSTQNRRTLDFLSTRYGLCDEDLEVITSHLKLCEEQNEDIRWDLIFSIIFPEANFDLEQLDRIVDPLGILVACALEEESKQNEEEHFVSAAVRRQSAAALGDMLGDGNAKIM